jgi:Cache domain
VLAFLKGNPGLSWVSYGDESGTFTGVYRTADGSLHINQSRILDGHTHLIERDMLPDGSQRVARRDDDSGYDPRTRPFYGKARDENWLVWLPPYVFYGQNVPGISCAAPLYNRAGRLRGVFSVDFDLHALSDFIAGLSVREHSRVFLFTVDEKLLAHPNLRTKSSNTEPAEHLPTLADTGDALVNAYRASLPPQ